MRTCFGFLGILLVAMYAEGYRWCVVIVGLGWKLGWWRGSEVS